MFSNYKSELLRLVFSVPDKRGVSRQKPEKAVQMTRQNNMGNFRRSLEDVGRRVYLTPQNSFLIPCL